VHWIAPPDIDAGPILELICRRFALVRFA